MSLNEMKNSGVESMMSTESDSNHLFGPSNSYTAICRRVLDLESSVYAAVVFDSHGNNLGWALNRSSNMTVSHQKDLEERVGSLLAIAMAIFGQGESVLGRSLYIGSTYERGKALLIPSKDLHFAMLVVLPLSTESMETAKKIREIFSP